MEKAVKKQTSDTQSFRTMEFRGADSPMLDCGMRLDPLIQAYETYGELNEDKSNAILVCHALTGDQYVTGTNPVTGKKGWWSEMIGHHLPVDTRKFFVICINILGSCMGSSGPKEINPKTNKPYALSFPVITISDIVKAQVKVIDALGIEKLHAIIGGSIGGMQVLEWATRYPERVHKVIPIATAARHSAQNIAFHEVGRQAIMADPEWHGGDYITHNKIPKKGLSVARMATHVAYLSEKKLHRKFGRNLQDRRHISYSFEADFQIESYLRHQGYTFVDRFDANSYLYLTRAANYFDLISESQGVLANAFRNSSVKFCIISFNSDWLYPTSESKMIVRALNACGAAVSFVEIETDNGHDSFLLNEPEFFNVIKGFIEK